MAVLAEAISVIVRRKAIDQSYPGGWIAFVAEVPNTTLCADDQLARVGFMSPHDVEHFIEALCDRGLLFVVDDRAADIIVVDQQRGPTVPCDWIEFGRVNLSGVSKTVAVCRHVDSTQNEVITPDAWRFEGSLSEQFQFVSTDQLDVKMKFLRQENGLDVYLNLDTGTEVFVARMLK